MASSEIGLFVLYDKKQCTQLLLMKLSQMLANRTVL